MKSKAFIGSKGEDEVVSPVFECIVLAVKRCVTRLRSAVGASESSLLSVKKQKMKKPLKDQRVIEVGENIWDKRKEIRGWTVRVYKTSDKTTGEIEVIDSLSKISDTLVYQLCGSFRIPRHDSSKIGHLLHELYPVIQVDVVFRPYLYGMSVFKGGRYGKILINKKFFETADILPRGYAYHYIGWFTNTLLVDRGIMLWGSGEDLVKAMGENAVKMVNWKWYDRFFNWIRSLFNKKLSILNKLTNNFLIGKELSPLRVSVKLFVNRGNRKQSLQKNAFVLRKAFDISYLKSLYLALRLKIGFSHLLISTCEEFYNLKVRKIREILEPSYNVRFVPLQYSFSVYETSIMAGDYYCFLNKNGYVLWLSK